jgi:nuclear pore complex protein Nup160
MALFSWAVSGTFDFGEWLSNTNQTILIEEYVRLLNSWCEYNSCSRQFILAVSYLRNGESSKALDLFLDCAKGINDEHYLKQLIAPQKASRELSPNEALAQYFLKVIKFFENQSCYDCVISVSEIAIGTVKDHQLLAMFQSILFNNHLYLYHYVEAYNTILECEPSRRKDCLRQLVHYLFQEKRFDILLEFKYVGLESDLENIIETRARSMQIDNNDHYEILYAFHMMKLNMRKASMVMYEKALRYTYESSSVMSLEGRHKSLLSCVNTLNLVDKEYRWIVKPVIDDQPDESGSDTSGRASGGGDSSSDEEDDLRGHKRDVVVVELADIRKELMLVDAMLIVARASGEQNQVYSMDAAELIILLANEKYYTNAVNLAKLFAMPLTAIFKSLTLACLQANDGEFDSWNWIDNNDLSGIVISRNASDILWSFLKRLLEDEGGDEQHNYLKAVVQQILANDAFLPQWLMDAYKVS